MSALTNVQNSLYIMADAYDPEIPTEDQEGSSQQVEKRAVMAAEPSVGSDAKVKGLGSFGAKKLLKDDDKPIKFQILGKKLPLVQYSDDESDNAASGRSTPVVRTKQKNLKDDALAKVNSHKESFVGTETDGALVKLATYDSDSDSGKNLNRGKSRDESALPLEKREIQAKRNSRWSEFPRTSVDKKESKLHSTTSSGKETKVTNPRAEPETEKSIQSRKSASLSTTKISDVLSSRTSHHTSESHKSSSAEQSSFRTDDSQKTLHEKYDKKRSSQQPPKMESAEKVHHVIAKAKSSGLSPSSRDLRSSPSSERSRNDNNSRQDGLKKSLAVKQQRRVSLSPAREETRQSQKSEQFKKTHQKPSTVSHRSRDASPLSYERHSLKHHSSPVENSFQEFEPTSDCESSRRSGHAHSNHKYRKSSLDQNASKYADEYSPYYENTFKNRSSKSFRQVHNDSPSFEKRSSMFLNDRYKSSYSSETFEAERRPCSTVRYSNRDRDDYLLSPDQHSSVLSRSESYHYRDDVDDAFETRGAKYVHSKDDVTISRASLDQNYRSSRGYENQFEEYSSRDHRQFSSSHEKHSDDRRWTSSYDECLDNLGADYSYQNEKGLTSTRTFAKTEDRHVSHELRHSRSSSHYDDGNVDWDYRSTGSREIQRESRHGMNLSRQDKYPASMRDVRHGSSHSECLPNHDSRRGYAKGDSLGRQIHSKANSRSAKDEEEIMHQNFGSKSSRYAITPDFRSMECDDYHAQVLSLNLAKDEDRLPRAGGSDKKVKAPKEEPKQTKGARKKADKTESSSSSSSESDDGSSDSDSSSSSSSSSGSSSSSSSSNSSVSGKIKNKTKSSGKVSLQKPDFHDGKALVAKETNAKSGKSKTSAVETVVSGVPRNASVAPTKSPITSVKPIKKTDKKSGTSDSGSSSSEDDSSSSDSSSSSSTSSLSHEELTEKKDLGKELNRRTPTGKVSHENIVKCGRQVDTVSAGNVKHTDNHDKVTKPRAEPVKNLITEGAKNDASNFSKDSRVSSAALSEDCERKTSKPVVDQVACEIKPIHATIEKDLKFAKERDKEKKNEYSGDFESTSTGKGHRDSKDDLLSHIGGSVKVDSSVVIDMLLMSGGVNITDAAAAPKLNNSRPSLAEQPGVGLDITDKSDKSSGSSQSHPKVNRDVRLVPTVVLKAKTAKLKSAEGVGTVKNVSPGSEVGVGVLTSMIGSGDSAEVLSKTPCGVNTYEASEEVVPEAISSVALQNMDDDLSSKKVCVESKNVPQEKTSSAIKPLISLDRPNSEENADESCVNALQDRSNLTATVDTRALASPTDGQSKSKCEIAVSPLSSKSGDKSGEKTKWNKTAPEVKGPHCSNSTESVGPSSCDSRTKAEERHEKASLHSHRKRSNSRGHRSKSRNRSSSSSSRRSRSRRRHHRSNSRKRSRSRSREKRDHSNWSKGTHDQSDKYYKDRRLRSSSRGRSHRSRSRSGDRRSRHYNRPPDRHNDRDYYSSRHRECYDRDLECYDRDRKQRTPEQSFSRNYDSGSHSIEKRSYNRVGDGSSRSRLPDAFARQHHLSSDLDAIPLPSAGGMGSSTSGRQSVSGKTSVHSKPPNFVDGLDRQFLDKSPHIHNILLPNSMQSPGKQSERGSVDMELENSDDQGASVVDSSISAANEFCSPGKSKMVGGKVAFVMKDSSRKPLMSKKKSVFEDDSDNSNDAENRFTRNALRLRGPSKTSSSSKGRHFAVSELASSSTDAKATESNSHRRSSSSYDKNQKEKPRHSDSRLAENEQSRTEVSSSSRCDRQSRTEERRKDTRDGAKFNETSKREEKPKDLREPSTSGFEIPIVSLTSSEDRNTRSATVSNHSAFQMEPGLVAYPVLNTFGYAAQSTTLSNQCEKISTLKSSESFNEQSVVSSIAVVTDSSRTRPGRFWSSSSTHSGQRERRFMDFPSECSREEIGVMISENRPVRRDSRDRIKVERICMVKPVTLAEEKEVSSSTADVQRVSSRTDSRHKTIGEAKSDIALTGLHNSSRHVDAAKVVTADSTKKDAESGSPLSKSSFDNLRADGLHTIEKCDNLTSAHLQSAVSKPEINCTASDKENNEPVISETNGCINGDIAEVFDLKKTELTSNEILNDVNFVYRIPSPHCCIWEALDDLPLDCQDDREKGSVAQVLQQLKPEPGESKCLPFAETAEHSASEKKDKRRCRFEQTLESANDEQKSTEEQQNNRRRSTRLRSREEKRGVNSTEPDKSSRGKKRVSESKVKKDDEASVDEQQRKSTKNLKARILSVFDGSSVSDSSVSSQVTADMIDVQNLQKSCSSSVRNSDLGVSSGGEGNFTTPVKPEKVKSRWRRCSELDSNSSIPPPPPPPSLLEAKPREFHQPAYSAKCVASMASLPEEVDQPMVLHSGTDKLELVEDAGELCDALPIEEKDEEPEEQPYFEEIQDNIFLSERDTKKSRKEARRMVCDCTLPSPEDLKSDVEPCGQDCLNRMLMIECGSRCPCGDLCTNRLFQQHQYAKSKSFKAGSKGWGLQACEDMIPGTFIMEYVGEVLDYEQFMTRTKEYAKGNAVHHYFMALNADEVIDATQKGNISRFINHSCDPNAETQKWTVNGQLRIGFFIIKPVLAGEEITFNYQFENYGEQMKCYCGAANCSGVIGSNKSNPLKNKRNKETKQKDKKKKKELFSDLFLEEEIDAMLRRVGMHRKDHVLELNRLMLRAETTEHRLNLLKVLQGTKEPACLRLFLEYHGLLLLWSWMVDVPSEAKEFKMQTLKTLKILPINNKTMLKDSKVLSVVEKWSQELSNEGKDLSQSQKPKIENDRANDSATDGTSEKSDDTKRSDSNSAKCEELLAPNIEKGSGSTVSEKSFPPKKQRLMMQLQQVEAGSSDGEPSESAKTEDSESQMGEESSEADGQNEGTMSDQPTTQTFDEASEDESNDAGAKSSKPKLIGVIDLATELLSEWKNLKEVYKIPKIMVEERKKTEQELDRQYEERSLVSRRDSYSGWDKNEWRRRSDESPEVRYVNKRRRTIDDSDDCRSAKTRKVLLPTPQALTKQERRQQFEAQVKAQEEMQKELMQQQQQQQPDSTYQDYFASSSDASSTVFAAAVTDPAYPQDPLVTIPFQEVSSGLPYVYDELGSVCYDPYYQDPAATASTFHDSSSLQFVDANSGMIGQTAYIDPNQASLIYSAHGLQYGGQTMYYSSTQGPVLLPQAVGQTVYQSPASVTSPYVQITSDQSTLQSLQIRQLTKQLEIARRQGPTDPRDPPPPPPSPPKAKMVRLPPNWKTAKDSSGKVYYYHTVTRQTQWDPPALDSGIGGDGAEEDDMDLGTPTNDDSKKQRKRTTTAAADTSSEEVAKKIKDQFRAKIAKHIITYLSPYRRADCDQGRITGADDFKHLARKLTHTIMNKELKHCRHLEDLEVNENVKGKAKDFVNKYMSKFGSLYKPSAASP